LLAIEWIIWFIQHVLSWDWWEEGSRASVRGAV